MEIAIRRRGRCAETRRLGQAASHFGVSGFAPLISCNARSRCAPRAALSVHRAGGALARSESLGPALGALRVAPHTAMLLASGAFQPRWSVRFSWRSVSWLRPVPTSSLCLMSFGSKPSLAQNWGETHAVSTQHQRNSPPAAESLRRSCCTPAHLAGPSVRGDAPSAVGIGTRGSGPEGGESAGDCASAPTDQRRTTLLRLGGVGAPTRRTEGRRDREGREGDGGEWRRTAAAAANPHSRGRA